jgi:hypothetical protein
MRTLAGAVAVTVCLVLAGCQDDGGDGAGGEPSPTGSATSPESPTSVPAATGPAVDGDTFAAHVPEGWRLDASFSTDFIDQFDHPAQAGELMSFGEFDGEVRPFEQAAKENFASFQGSGRKRRMPDTEVAGQTMWHFVSREPLGVKEEYGTVYQGHNVTLGVELGGTPEERRQVVESVLASWEWQ